jgi:hypothetical protein
MTTSRTLLITFAVLAALAAVGTAAAAPRDNESVAAEAGGALAEPYAAELEGGGNVAPSDAPEAEAAASAEDDAVAGAAPAQEETPSTAEGGEQLGQEPGVEQPAGTVESIANEQLPGPVGDTGTSGGLPSTGAELLAMATIGLGLLRLGAALRPSRRPTDGR